MTTTRTKQASHREEIAQHVDTMLAQIEGIVATPEEMPAEPEKLYEYGGYSFSTLETALCYRLIRCYLTPEDRMSLIIKLSSYNHGSMRYKVFETIKNNSVLAFYIKQTFQGRKLYASRIDSREVVDTLIPNDFDLDGPR